MSTRLATLLLILATAMAPAAPLHAQAAAQESTAPASAQSLRHVFAAENVEGRMRESMQAIDARHAQRLGPDNDTDPARRARRARLRQELGDWLREQFDWSARLEPMAVQAWQGVYREEDAQALLAYYRSPAGQIYLQQWPAALAAAEQTVQDHVRAQVAQWIAQLPAAGESLPEGPTTPLAVAAPPASTQEQQAAQLLALLGMQGRLGGLMVRTKMAAIDTLDQRLPPGDAAVQKARAQYLTRRMREELPADMALPLAAPAVAARLPPPALQTLLEGERTAAREAQRALAARAADAFGLRLREWLARDIQPEILRRLSAAR